MNSNVVDVLRLNWLVDSLMRVLANLRGHMNRTMYPNLLMGGRLRRFLRACSRLPLFCEARAVSSRQHTKVGVSVASFFFFDLSISRVMTSETGKYTIIILGPSVVGAIIKINKKYNNSVLHLQYD